MTVQVNETLSDNAVSQLQELIQINVDSRDGFWQAAEATDDVTLKSAFEQMAKDRDAQADELAVFVAWSGATPRREGSISAAVHRTWMTIRDMVSSDNRYAMLCEAERGEDFIKAAYEYAIKDVMGNVINDVLLRQYAAVKTAHDRIRDLRDEFRVQ